MSENKTHDTVFSILAELSGKSTNELQQLDPETPLNVIGIDSIMTVQLILALEEKLDVSIPEDKLDKQHLGSLSAVLKTALSLK